MVDKLAEERNMKRVILTLEYDMGDYSDREDDGMEISLRPEDYEETFQQADIFTCDMRIVGVRIDATPPE